MFKKHTGVEYKITGVFKPRARLLMSLREPGGEVNNDPTKQDHDIAVGGPGNRLDGIYPSPFIAKLQVT